MSTIADIVLDQLAKVTDDEEVRQNLDLELFEEGILDSLGTMELIVALGEALHLEISPAQFDRQKWSTPRKIIANVEAMVKP